MIKLLTVITALIYVISVLTLISSATAQKEITLNSISSTKTKHIVHHNNGNIDSAKTYSDDKR